MCTILLHYEYNNLLQVTIILGIRNRRLKNKTRSSIMSVATSHCEVTICKFN